MVVKITGELAFATANTARWILVIDQPVERFPGGHFPGTAVRPRRMTISEKSEQAQAGDAGPVFGVTRSFTLFCTLLAVKMKAVG